MANVYKIGVVGTRVGVSAATLRAWEEQYGLLQPQRTPRGTRLYSAADIDRARRIKTLIREQGFSLQAVATALEEGDGNGSAERDVHGVLRRLVRAQFGWQGAAAFVEGARALTGAAVASLGLYLPSPESIFFAVTALSGRTRRIGGVPIAVCEFPAAWQAAIDGHHACSDSDLRRMPLGVSLAAWVKETRLRSFYAEPLTVGWRLVGVLMIGSPIVGGISKGAAEICGRLAAPAGPALSSFGAQFQ